MGISSSAAEVSFQPLLVNVFAVSDAELGSMYVATSLLALTASVLSAALSRRLRDRYLLMLGLAVNIFGALCYLPFFPQQSVTQVALGFLCGFRVSLFGTVLSSVYTKAEPRLDERRKGIAYMNAAVNFSGATTRFLIAHWFVGAFGTWQFAVFLVPLVAMVAVVAWRWRSFGAVDESCHHCVSL